MTRRDTQELGMKGGKADAKHEQQVQRPLDRSLGSLKYEDATGWLLKRCLIKENRTSDTIMTMMTRTNSYCGFTMCLALTI